MNSRAFCLSDYASKLLFNSYNYGRDVAVAIICDITNLPEEEVNKNLEVVHPNVSINKKTVKSETDLVYKNDTRIFNIEINLKSGKGVEAKNDIYTYQLALHDVTSSKKYKNLKQTIQINIDNYDYLGENEFIYHAKMLDVKFHKRGDNIIEIYHINLSKLRKIEKIKLEGRLKKLLYMFICNDENKLDEIYKGDEFLMGVKEEVKRISDKDDWSELFYDPQDIEELNIQGYIEKGIEQGIKQGIKQGENKKQIEIAKSLFELNVDRDTIKKSTKLNDNELDALKKDK